MNVIKLYILFLLSILCVVLSNAQESYRDSVKLYMEGCCEEYQHLGPFEVKSISPNLNNRTYRVVMNDIFATIPFRPEMVDSIEANIQRIISATMPDYKVSVVANKKNIRFYIPNYYSRVVDEKRGLPEVYPTVQFKRNVSQPYNITQGLQDRNLAIWQSHGLFYDQRTDRWQWQRARVMTTVEDKFTLSFVIPYLAPMLERAGANVFMPRERDLQQHEVIVDNDSTEFTRGLYREYVAEGECRSGGNSGFAVRRSSYIQKQNPFRDGTYRVMNTDKVESASILWAPIIPEEGWYWVSVAYAASSKAVSDARYTVRHAAGETHFVLNQQIGAATWIYLGQFYFRKGHDVNSAAVVLSNQSEHSGVVVADAVRWGGGMGCVARRPAHSSETAMLSESEREQNVISCFDKSDYTTSGRAKFWEAACYWLQWAGAPYNVYSHSEGLNDYVDDYASRGPWVNWLNAGSHFDRDSEIEGLKIPIDAAMAFHSDAGCLRDSVVGTLGIFTSMNDRARRITTLPNGQSRFTSRDLTDMVQSQVVDDIRKSYTDEWTRRWIWDRSYNESRTSCVPTMLLELLSHQNFDDMKYGLDPRFKFVVSRAIYKAMARYVAFQNNQPLVIAPLPVEAMAMKMHGYDSLLISWRSVVDSLEPSAVAKRYVVYSRFDGEGWDNGVLVDVPRIVLPLPINRLMSYKVVAINDGGASMDSEILSAYRAPNSRATVLVVNGFSRVAAPEGMNAFPFVGFPEWNDHGVSDGADLQFVGTQHDFDFRHPWISDDSSGWGQSNSDHEFAPPAGNTFDFPLVHGRVMANLGYSFISCSHLAVEEAMVLLDDFSLVDLMLGEQKQTFYGSDKNSCSFKTFSVNLQRVLRAYTLNGGSLFVSGAHVVSDCWWGRNSSQSDRDFLRDVLHVEWRADRAAQNGELVGCFSPALSISGKYDFAQNINDSIYEVESPDALVPASKNAFTVMRYAQNSNSAAVAFADKNYRSVVCGFPFETILTMEQRVDLMQQIFNFLLSKNVDTSDTNEK